MIKAICGNFGIACLTP
ncbi:DUF3265 domain-containing protein [Vibrio sp. CAU 1672]|nr:MULTISPECIES: DUF3265 domain-containing protein [Vibrio]MCU8181740.1 DUF3265 domain-containing protein [Vibrio vulnificus]MCU8457315.1 DUF3265 domain-containing protein [Vibrio vulnificus]MDF2156062.1 DUF3265 domain-containing protein [Vibrio sp. CAU 1672]MDF4602887.1 DUF3265 domain-containing protein [Vibrio parahaemolyticus]